MQFKIGYGNIKLPPSPWQSPIWHCSLIITLRHTPCLDWRSVSIANMNIPTHNIEPLNYSSYHSNERLFHDILFRVKNTWQVVLKIIYLPTPSCKLVFIHTYLLLNL